MFYYNIGCHSCQWLTFYQWHHILWIGWHHCQGTIVINLLCIPACFNAKTYLHLNDIFTIFTSWRMKMDCLWVLTCLGFSLPTLVMTCQWVYNHPYFLCSDKICVVLLIFVFLLTTLFRLLIWQAFHLNWHTLQVMLT